MIRLRLIPLLLAFALLGGSIGCKDDAPAALRITSPSKGETVTICEVPVAYEITDPDFARHEVLLDSAPAPGLLVDEVSPGHWEGHLERYAVEPGPHVLEIRGTRSSDGKVVTTTRSFTLGPRARAYEVTSEDDLITGPLAHNVVGDFMLENCEARFAIQSGAQRDLYSVGQYGGNLIDAELMGHPGLDNFLEVQSMVNVETVLNAQEVFIVNDGADGQPAVVRACGPDDLLDFVNPSSQVTDIPLPFPAELNDNDQTVEGCTDYSVSVLERHLSMTTTFTNTGDEPITLLSGDWMNSSGELDTLGVPNIGVGPALTNVFGVLGFFGFDEARGVDYAYTSTPVSPGSYVVISGVTVILHDAPVLSALLGGPVATDVAPGETYRIERYFAVGDGSGSNAVDLMTDIKELDHSIVSGCITVDSVNAPGAIVTIGTFDDSDVITSLLTSGVAGDDGCFRLEVPLPASPLEAGMVISVEGTPYQGGGPTPTIQPLTLTSNNALIFTALDLPATGRLAVTAVDASGAALPVRISVVGFDPSPPIILPGPSLPSFGGSTLGLFLDPDDSRPFGIVDAVHTGADGEAEFDLEPESYRIVVSRGTEYSIYDEAVTITAGATTQVDAAIALVLDTAGFVSSDFHVHGINSADSRVSHKKRVEGYAGEGVDNIVMTDHHAHTDLDPTIAELGLGDWLSSTIGEEITTFDYGHFNAYPLTIDATRPSGGSTDWAMAAPAGQDFPSAGAFNATPAEIFALATTGANSTPDTTVQVNHIGSHFGPMQIDTSLVPPSDDLDDAERLERRLDEPVTTNLFHAFPALELWNGASRGAQNDFLEDRIGIWFNLLSQGIRTTFIADTDSHRHDSLRMAGARTWTAAAPGTDSAGTVDDGEVARMVDAGKAVGGQGVFVTTTLLATDGSGARADFTHDGSTTLTGGGEDVVLAIRVQAPAWSAFDTIEIYANAATTPVDPDKPYAWTATPTQVLSEGDCDASTTGDGDFDITVREQAPSISGGQRLQAYVPVRFSGLSEDTWFVVVVKATDGVCPALFPVFPAGLAPGSNATVADLMDGNVGENGVLALGATNALYFEYEAP